MYSLHVLVFVFCFFFFSRLFLLGTSCSISSQTLLEGPFHTPYKHHRTSAFLSEEKMHVSFFFFFFPLGILRHRQNEHDRFITSRTTVKIDVVITERKKDEKRKRFYELHAEQPFWFCATK
jgi:tellurite resistance protein TehA-like permease